MAKFSLATFLDSYENGHRVKKRSEKIIETPHFSLVNCFLFPLKPPKINTLRTHFLMDPVYVQFIYPHVLIHLTQCAV